MVVHFKNPAAAFTYNLMLGINAIVTNPMSSELHTWKSMYCFFCGCLLAVPTSRRLIDLFFYTVRNPYSISFFRFSYCFLYLLSFIISFIFSPAYTQYFNDYAESGIKLTKFHLKQILRFTHLTFEELSSMLSQVAAILNSRSLCPLP